MSNQQSDPDKRKNIETRSMKLKSERKINSQEVRQVLKKKDLFTSSKLESIIKYLDSLKCDPSLYVIESDAVMRPLLGEAKPEERYIIWLRYFDITYKKLEGYVEDKDVNIFKDELCKFLERVLFESKKEGKKLDWRIVRKLYGIQDLFISNENTSKGTETNEKNKLKSVQVSHNNSLNNKAFLEIQNKDLIQAVQMQIKKALKYLLWQNPTYFIELATKTLELFQEMLENEEYQENIQNAIYAGRFDKEIFKLKGTLIMGEDGGLYLLLNSLTEESVNGLVDEQIVTEQYLKDKIKGKKSDQTSKIILGKGAFGAVRFALSLFQHKASPGQVMCVKKTGSFESLSSGNDLTGNPLEQIIENTVDDYFTSDIAKAIYAPNIFDLALVTDSSIADSKHCKGYLMMEVLPQNTGTKVFSGSQFQKWDYQKPYLVATFKHIQELLDQNMAMTDLKPDNTLYDYEALKTTLIDLGGTVKVKNQAELEQFDVQLYTFQCTPSFSAPELQQNEGLIDVKKALSYGCGRIMEDVTRITDHEKSKIKQLVEKLKAEKPQE